MFYIDLASFFGEGKPNDEMRRMAWIDDILNMKLRLSATFEYALDAVVGINSNGEIVDWNPQAEVSFGWSRDEALGQKIADLIIPERYQEAHKRSMNLFLTSGSESIINKRVESVALRKNGEEFPIELSMCSIQFDHAPVFYSFIRDITERKRAERDLQNSRVELMRARDRAEEANRAKTLFLANMSHEIRTPLTAIIGFTELILNPGRNDEDNIYWGLKIRENSSHLLKIIDDILDYSKMECGAVHIDRTKTDIRKIVNGVKSIFSPQAEKKGIQLKFLVESPIPQYVVTDPVRLKQILLNVIGNAVKFTSQGSVQVAFRMNAHNHLEVLVSDSGPGFTSEQMDKLYQPFTQVDLAHARKYGGSGLGLALAKRLAVQLGGDITLLHSVPGKGSTFLISIDAGELENTAYIRGIDFEGTMPMLATSSLRSGLHGSRILLVDDSADNRLLISKFLSYAGAEIDLACDAAEGIDKALSNRFDIVLMDIQMPEKDGYQATQELRAQGYVKPIIALTAHALKGERERSLQYGCDEHLTKPISQKNLVENLLRYLS